MGDEPHISAPNGRVQIPHRSTGPLATADVHFHRAKAFVLTTVHVVADGIARLLACVDKGLIQRIARIPASHRYRPVGAAKCAATGHIFQALEIRQHIGPVPTFGTQGLPQLIVHRIAAHPAHPVDG